MQAVCTASCAGLLFRCAPKQPLLQALCIKEYVLNFDKKIFISNLTTTLKFLGLVWLALSFYIVFDSIRHNSYKYIFFSIQLIAFSFPSILFGVWTYTLLKLSDMSKFICSILFSSSLTALVILTYILATYLETDDIDIFVIRVTSVVDFIVLMVIYLQLPYEEDA